MNSKKLLKYIPGGSHTYSRGIDQFPSGSPEILVSGKGCYVFDLNKKKYLDYGMGLRSVNLGYANKEVNTAVSKAISLGNNLTLPSTLEYEAAKKFVSTITNVDMVKFTKHGSTAVTAAVKLARAFTKKNIILRCKNHPFFSFDDWFIGSTVINKGVPKEISKLTLTFDYNDIQSLKKLVKKYKNKISCVVLEPSSTECPKINNTESSCCGKEICTRNFKKENHFLKQVETVCRENKIVFILDEMITGFRWHLKGAQHFYNVKPDISTFGKAMANGYSLAAVAGRREIMELGSIEKKGAERVFLLSSTHGSEMTGMAAFLSTLEKIKKNDVIKKKN